MQTSAARVLLITSVICCSASCAPAEPAAAPRASLHEDDRAGQNERDQEALERRRLQLEKQLLTDLRKLRESRQASTAGAEPARDEAASSADCELLVFGGRIHDAFLGCLCDESRPDSVFNMTGEHGSDLSPMSMRNKFAPYGSNYDDTSACNAAATHPPVVVTSDGKSLGLLTVNPSLKKRIKAPSVVDWLARMCGV
jgi:hypothetical protein